jgi:hypothetical protein
MALWPDATGVYNASIEEYTSSENLIQRMKFAERTDGSPKGDGSGPFFVAAFTPKSEKAHVTIDGSNFPVADLYSTVQYRVGDLDCYQVFQPGVRDGERVILYAYAYFKNGSYETGEPGFIPITDYMINAADTSGMFVGRVWNSWGPYPDPSIVDSPSQILTWLLNLAATGVMRGVDRFFWFRADFEKKEDKYVPCNEIPLMHSEHAYYTSVAHPGFSSPFYARGMLHSGLFSAAYYDAQDKLPQILSNTFQNLLEAGSTVISLANGIDLNDLKSLRRLAGNAWLGYRYQYNTTVSDLEELESSIERFDDLSRMKGSLTSYGRASDSTGNFHCALVVDSQQILNRSLLAKLNLRPTLANAWDMIPYSFIVDWFTGIGDVLAAIDKWLDAPSFGNVFCWYSYTNEYYVPDQGVVTCYFRYPGKQPLLPYWSMDVSHSGETWSMRALDTVSLLR